MYRYYLYSDEIDRKSKCSSIKEIFYRVYKDDNSIDKRLKINIKLICVSPFLYKVFYYIYNKIRKPNWDVE